MNPITTDQLNILLMNNVCEPSPYVEALGIRPLAFVDGINEYIK